MSKASFKLPDRQLIAPCGLDCRLCRAYIRENNPCPGCRGDDSKKSNACIACKIKNCPRIASGKASFCYECNQFPCQPISSLEKRYANNYGVSIFSNLKQIKKRGLQSFLKHENKIWACPECKERLCMHKNECVACGYVWRWPGSE